MMLLEIPPELRIKVLEFALREDEVIQIRDGQSVNPPDWINACKQIRAETYKTWVKTNCFLIHVRDLDVTHLHKFAAHLRSIEATAPDVTATVADSHNWQNLLSWCRRVQTRTPGTRRIVQRWGPYDTKTYAVVKTAMKIGNKAQS
jgi:hypothetical protein